jgi:hypothetical protein
MGHLLIVCFRDAVLTLSTVINHLVSLSMGGTKVVQDCYVSLMESCIQLKEVEEDGDNDDDDGAEDLDDDDEEEDTEDDDEVNRMKTLLCTFSFHA